MIENLTARIDSIKLTPRVQYLLLAVISVFALILRLYKLGEFSYWIDEVITVMATDYLSDWPLTRLPINLVLIRASIDLFGISHWSARLAPALIGVVSLPVLYFPIRKLFGPGVALLAILFLAVSPWHLFWSQNARFYTLLMLLYNLGLLYYFIGTEKNSLWTILLSVFLFLVTVREKMSGFFFIFVIPSYWVLVKRLTNEKSQIYNLRNASLVFVPIVLFGAYDFLRVSVFHLPSMIMEFFEVFGRPERSPLRTILSVVYRIGIPMLCLGIFGGIYLLIKRSRTGLFILLGAVVPVLVLFVLANFMYTFDRYVFITLPFWAILTAVAVHALYVNSRGLAKLLAVGVIVLLITNSLSENFLYYAYQNGNRPDWKGAFEVVKKEYRQGDEVYTSIIKMGKYYLGEEVDDRTIQEMDVEQLVRSSKRVWFVYDKDVGFVSLENEQLIQQNARLVNIRKVGMPGKTMDIMIYLYDPLD